MLHSTHLATAPPGGLVAKRPSTTSLPNLDVWPRQLIPTAFQWNGPGIWVLWTAIRIGKLRYDGVFNESYCPAFFSGVALVKVWCHATDRIRRDSDPLIWGKRPWAPEVANPLLQKPCLAASWPYTTPYSATESHNTQHPSPPNIPMPKHVETAAQVIFHDLFRNFRSGCGMENAWNRGTMGHHGAPWGTMGHLGLADAHLDPRDGTFWISCFHVGLAPQKLSLEMWYAM